ncbi:MAG: DNA polymerase III subunit gamma/tau [Lentisphaerales bacterium]|nr:DNA polymerase III subunit gamma/tau [Lentisphaerales bacterium]
MTYQVLARKWRPQTFKDMVGQDHISSTLCNAIKNQRVGHAYLFVGTRGTGKTTTARIFAKVINCENPLPDANPCDQCTNCKEITAGSCMDVLEIDGASNNGVDDIRRLRDNVQYTPARCNYKVYIIDEVHMLSTAAWNALLKTLEEPPEHVKFLFATTEVHKVLPTILSRCQRFDLKRISQGTISRRLLEIAQAEQASFDQSALNAIARAANGGMRDALSIMDQMIAFCNSQEAISEHDVSEVFGLTSNNDLAKITIAMLNDNAAELIKEVNRLADVGRNLEQLYSDLLHFSRNLMICAISGDQAKNILDLDNHEITLTCEIVSQSNTDTLQRLVDGYLAHDGQLKNRLNKRVFLEMTLVRIMKDAHAASLNDILKRLNSLRKSGSLSALEFEAPKQTISVQLPDVEKKTPSNPVEEKTATEVTQPITEEYRATEIKPHPVSLSAPDDLTETESSKTEEIIESAPSLGTAPVTQIQPEPHLSPKEERPDYLTQVPENIQSAIEQPSAPEVTQPIAEEAPTAEPSQTEVSDNVKEQEAVLDEKHEPALQKSPPEAEATSSTIEKLTIDDTIELSYNTLIDMDYISKARIKDPCQFGLQRYQSDFNENEDTPGSALGVFYYRESNSGVKNEAPTVTESNITGEHSPDEAQTSNDNTIVNDTLIQQKVENTSLSQAVTEITASETIIEQPSQKEPIPQQYINSPEQTIPVHNHEHPLINEAPAIPAFQPEVAAAPTHFKVQVEASQAEKPEDVAVRIWSNCQMSINQQNPVLIPLLNSLTPVSLTSNTFILTTENPIEVSEELTNTIRAMVSQVDTISGYGIKIITASPQTEDYSRTLSSNEEVWDRVNSNPLFSQLCQEFDGTIIDVRG